jgi:predicted metal-dependent enzyme (double-stranded beta helix superfamily)
MSNHARFRAYTAAMTRLVSGTPRPEAALLDEGEALLRDLLDHDDWLPPELARSSSESYRQYLLHCDPLERFSVVSFVWEPGQRTPIHDHLTWGLVGQLRGTERCQEFARDAHGGVRNTGEHLMRHGQVDRVSPTIGDVHVVSNAGSEVAVSIHVYGANIGAVRRHIFRQDGTPREFVSGYHNAWLPNIWSEQPRN